LITVGLEKAELEEKREGRMRRIESAARRDDV